MVGYEGNGDFGIGIKYRKNIKICCLQAKAFDRQQGKEKMEYITVKTALSPCKKTPFWFEYDYSMNLYRGCCHGCIYCDSRSECYQIEQFDRVRAKADIIKILEQELVRKRKKGIVCTGSMSDPYNPFEEELQLTKKALELFAYYGYGVAIFTKSDLILRDLDILKEINSLYPVLCCLTITTADDSLSRVTEPYVSSSTQRFSAIRRLSEAGIYTGVLMTPVLPFLTDYPDNINQLVVSSKENGAKFIYPMFGMTLRDRQRQYYYQKLEEYFPGRKKQYQKIYGTQYYCQAPNAGILKEQFEKRCKEFGLLYRLDEINRGYQKRNFFEQMSLFDFT